MTASTARFFDIVPIAVVPNRRVQHNNLRLSLLLCIYVRTSQSASILLTFSMSVRIGCGNVSGKILSGKIFLFRFLRRIPEHGKKDISFCRILITDRFVSSGPFFGAAPGLSARITADCLRNHIIHQYAVDCESDYYQNILRDQCEKNAHRHYLFQIYRSPFQIYRSPRAQHMLRISAGRNIVIAKPHKPE